MTPKDSDTVYVTIGRRSGKTMIQARQMEELMKSGKKVVLVEPKLASKRNDWLIDRDILDPERMKRAELMLNKILKGE